MSSVHQRVLVSPPPADLSEAGPFLEELGRWLASDATEVLAIVPRGENRLEAWRPHVKWESALIIPTSGSTTRKPNLVVLPKLALQASIAATQLALSGPGQWLLALPLRHVAGLQVVLRSFSAGEYPLLPRKWPKVTVEEIGQAALKATSKRLYVSVVSSQLATLLRQSDHTVDAWRRFDTILVGGGHLDPSLLTKARERGLAVTTTYGATETAGGCVYNALPLPGVQLRIGDKDEILIASPSLMSGYWDSPAQWVDDSGTRFWRTGDVGGFHDDGRLFVSGRLDDIVKSGGTKVSLTEVDQALQKVPGVRDAACCTVPDTAWGESVMAVVSPSSAAVDPEEVFKTVRARLGASAAPRGIVFVDAVPRTDLGKPKRTAIRDLIGVAQASGAIWRRR